MATLLLYNSGTVCRTRPVSNRSVDPELRSQYAPPKTVRFSYRKCPGEILSNCACSVLRHTPWPWRYLHQTKFNLWKIITTVPAVVQTCPVLIFFIVKFSRWAFFNFFLTPLRGFTGRSFSDNHNYRTRHSTHLIGCSFFFVHVVSRSKFF